MDLLSGLKSYHRVWGVLTHYREDHDDNLYYSVFLTNMGLTCLAWVMHHTWIADNYR